ncbi:MAG: DNA-formamidopyrimidine glycosylase, partial [Chloroflexota bacterium]
HEADKWVHFRLQLADGLQLRFSDARKFGKVYLTNNIENITGHIGPEPLEDGFTVDMFKDRLAGRHKVIKSLLLDQTFVAGIGNIYADEALHRAGIHPLRRSDSLTDAEITALYGTIRAALFDGIEYEGSSISWYRKPDGTQGAMQNHFFVYNRGGQPCRTCGTTIEKTRVGQRGTHYCPNCQPHIT